MTDQRPRKIPVFDVALTKAVAEVLGQTEWPGLSNREIDQLLGQVGVRERPPGNKRDSLYIALHNKQVDQTAGNALSAFIARAMHPSRYVSDHAREVGLQARNGFASFPQGG